MCNLYQLKQGNGVSYLKLIFEETENVIKILQSHMPTGLAKKITSHKRPIMTSDEDVIWPILKFNMYTGTYFTAQPNVVPPLRCNMKTI